MSKVYIRWLGAFGKAESLDQSLRWELEDNQREVAATWCYFGTNGRHADMGPLGVDHAAVGLMVAKGAVVRRYAGDVWSVPAGDRLVKTRPASQDSDHGEAFCKPRFSALVIRKPLDHFRPAIRRAIVAAARKHGLKIMRIAERTIRTPHRRYGWGDTAGQIELYWRESTVTYLAPVRIERGQNG